MRYAPRKYDPALIEALAISGALKPNLDKDGRAKAIAKVAEWLGAGDLEADWSAKSPPRAAICSGACGAA